MDAIHFSDEKNPEEQRKIKWLKAEVDRLNDIILRSDTVLFVWTINENIPIKFVSENIKRFGYAPEDFYRGSLKDYWQFIYEPDRSVAKKRVYEAREQKKSEIKHRYRILCKNGDVRWMEEWMCLRFDAQGEIQEEKGFLRDIHQSVIMNEKILLNEKRLRRIYENTPLMIFSCQPDGVFQNMNSAMMKFIEVQKPIGENMLHFLLPHSKVQFRALLLNSKETKGVYEWDYDISGHKIKTLKLNFSKEMNKQGQAEQIHFYAEDITEQKEKDEQIKYLSEHDSLTNLYNRRVFEREMKDLYARRQFPFALVIGDINGLKFVNDAFGHETGDRYIVKVAQVISGMLGAGDMGARIGGDEFAILLSKSDEKRARNFVQQLVEKLKSIDLDEYIRPSVAFGYEIAKNGEMLDNELYRNADEKMYKNKLNDGKSVRSEMLSSLLSSLDKRTSESSAHCQQIKKMSENIAKEMQLPDNLIDELGLASLMHDIGKISIPDFILSKEGPLSAEEWQIMKKHPETGYHILMASPNLSSVGEIVLSHHEKWDGSGYPRGLKGEEIDICASILSVCDAYVSMTCESPYRKAKTKEEALKEMIPLFGHQFDPRVKDAFLRVVQNIEKTEDEHESKNL